MLLTVVSFVIVLGILVFFHELGHYWVARRNGIVVEEFGMGYPPRLVKLFRYDGTDFTLNLLPFGGFARMKGEDAGDMSPGSFNAASLGGRAATLIAGPLMNGDIVYAVDGVVVTPEVPLNILVDERRGEPLTMTVLRAGDLVAITTTPRAEPPPGQGALGVHIGTINRMANMALAPALWYGVTSIGDYAMTVLSLPMLLFQGEISPEEAQVSGPVGIAQMIGGAMSASLDSGLLFPILHLSAVLSAALAIMNLLPLPALDGGRLLFILIETVRGRRVSPEREGLIHMIGFMLLLGLMLIITVRDLSSTPQTIDWARLMGQ
jgi:regulator of sigma E protease